MIQSSCTHGDYRTNGKDRHGNTRYRCKLCGKTWVDVRPAKPLGDMTTPVDQAKLALRLLVEGNSIRATERISGLHRDTICKLLVKFGEKCQPASRVLHVRRLLQLHLADPQAGQERPEALNGCNDGRIGWACVELR